MPGWITVWLSLGPDGCKVELFLGGVDVDVDEAGLGSGGRDTSVVQWEFLHYWFVHWVVQ